MPRLDDLCPTVRRIAAVLREELLAIEARLPHVADADERFRLVRGALDRCVGELEALGLWGRENQVPSSELWNVAGDVLARGWMQHRARTKPRGYAGDFEMLAWMYESRTCDDPLGSLFDRYFQEEAAPVAVRNRMRLMADWIVAAAESRHELNQPLHVVMVGSAFGLEVRDALVRLSHAARQSVRVTLLDLDPAAIEFARGQLAPLLPAERLHAQSMNLFRLPERPRLAAALDGADLLFCPGIFDYLDDAAAAEMLQCFYSRLAPGGRMAVFQFAPHNPTRTYMEWIGNWYLLYRDRDSLAQLGRAAGLPDHATELSSEPLGVALYLSAHR